MMNSKTVRIPRPQQYSVRRPTYIIRNHELMVPTAPSAYWPIPISKGAFGTEPRLREEIDRIAHKAATAKSLNGPRKTDDLRPPQIRTLEALQIRRPGRVLDLELAGMDHHRDRLVDVEAGVVGAGAGGREACEGVFCFVGVGFADVPPGGIRGRR